MYVRTYLSLFIVKSNFTYERKIVGTCVRVYVCMYIDDRVRYILPVPCCRFRFLSKLFPFVFQIKKIAYSTTLLCTYLREY